MFEVAWCVTLYTTVLALEFAPAVFERLGWKSRSTGSQVISVPLMILGVMLSTLHQSSLGSLYLIVPHKLYALWYTPLLPVFFFISAICSGLGHDNLRIVAQQPRLRTGTGVVARRAGARAGGGAAVILPFVRFLDLLQRGVLGLLLVNRTETWLFWLEILLMLVPMLLLFTVARWSGELYGCALMVIFGFITNRLNVSITGMEAGSGTTTFRDGPKSP